MNPAGVVCVISIYLSICLSIYLSNHPSIYPSVYIYRKLSAVTAVLGEGDGHV